ncbi:hypothetical protein NFI96_000436 [Prochilodus magdalenae]|nr:hypothetical protein NFI96_000436 [Prochilodus magdalenae]
MIAKGAFADLPFCSDLNTSTLLKEQLTKSYIQGRLAQQTLECRWRRKMRTQNSPSSIEDMVHWSRAVREVPSISPPPAPSHDSFVEKTVRTMDQSWPVRVIVGENDIRKVTLYERPHNVEELITKLKNQLNLQFDFMLHYEDPDFNNAFCNLTDISELPNRATLKIIALESVFLTLSSASTMSSSTLSSASSSDTEILPRSELTLREQWPSTFEVPSFSVDIEYRLRQGNQIYMRDGKLMSVSRDMKHDILQKLAEEMYKYSAYPQD